MMTPISQVAGAARSSTHSLTPTLLNTLACDDPLDFSFVCNSLIATAAAAAVSAPCSVGEFHGTVSFLLVWWFLNVTLVRVSLCLSVCVCVRVAFLLRA